MDPARLLGLLSQARTETTLARVEPLLDPDQTPYFARTRLLTVTTVEAATAVVARAACLEHRPLEAVIEAWSARTPNPVSRALSRVQGKALLKAAAAFLPRIRVESMPLPVALGVVAAASGLSPDDLARLVGFDDVEFVLEGVDSTDALVWRHALLDDIVAMADGIAHLVDPERIPATGAPVAEWAMAQ